MRIYMKIKLGCRHVGDGVIVFVYAKSISPRGTFKGASTLGTVEDCLVATQDDIRRIKCAMEKV
jgi:hypothetical protein